MIRRPPQRNRAQLSGTTFLVAAIVLLSMPAQAAKPLPREVQASINDALKDCKGDVSKKQLDALDADLQASMPDAVKRQLSASGQSRDAGMQRSGSEQLGIPPALGEKSGYKPDPLRMAP